MKERQAKLLKLIVDQYVSTGIPVGSKSLLAEHDLEVSAATIRNEMRDLEERGYLTHPHTSAGRMPTEAGYRHVVTTSLKRKKISSALSKEIATIFSSDASLHDQVKQSARLIAETTRNAVIVSFGPDSLYYTGIGHLFSQQEFRDYAHTVAVSTILDQCEERFGALDEAVQDEVTILIGKENPLGTACSIVAKRYHPEILFTILGPMRMDYNLAVGLLETIHLNKT